MRDRMQEGARAPEEDREVFRDDRRQGEVVMNKRNKRKQVLGETG